VDEQASPILARGWRRWLLLGSVGPVLGIALGCTGAWWWPGEICSHWTLHGAVALLPAALVFRRQRRLGPLLMVAVLLGTMPWFAAAWEGRAPLPVVGQRALRVLHANIHKENERPAGQLPLLAGEPADLVSLIEVDAADRDSLSGDRRWPHQAWALAPAGEHGPAYGLALLSAHPIRSWVDHPVGTERFIEAEVVVDGRMVRVLVCHPKSPTSPGRLRKRRLQLAAVAAIAGGRFDPLIALGDFNCSVGSPDWREFRELSGLRRAARGAPATWPSPFGPLGIAIDHVLVGGGAALGGVEARSISDSDHRALAATVAF
jgi:endonuclease/exonuclease/phosphatase (EEP) superfamily protein YafD